MILLARQQTRSSAPAFLALLPVGLAFAAVIFVREWRTSPHVATFPVGLLLALLWGRALASIGQFGPEVHKFSLFVMTAALAVATWVSLRLP
jgi:hypothetical protein